MEWWERGHLQLGSGEINVEQVHGFRRVFLSDPERKSCSTPPRVDIIYVVNYPELSSKF